jgi:hypothetical protein
MMVMLPIAFAERQNCGLMKEFFSQQKETPKI